MRGDNTMPQTLVEIAKELTLALIQTWSIPPDRIPETLQHTYTTLTTLKVREEGGLPSHVPALESPPADWRKSITKHAVTCLECGDSFKQLSLRHLRMHGIDGRSYRVKYGIPRTQSLAARETTVRRRQIVQEIRPWEKAPTYPKGQAQDGSEAPEPEGEAVQDETEVPSAQAPAQPKRQRKTTPKKTARKTRSEG
jgi:predicted transcriptional regulator